MIKMGFAKKEKQWEIKISVYDSFTEGGSEVTGAVCFAFCSPFDFSMVKSIRLRGRTRHATPQQKGKTER